MNKQLVLSLLFACAAAGAQAQAVAQVDSNQVETGNPFIVHLQVPQSAGRPGQVDFSAWESLVPEQNILRQTEWLSDGQSFAKDLTLVFFDADTLTLPPLPIHLNGKGEALTNTLDLVIVATPSPDDVVDMSDIKDIRREPTFWTDYLPFLLAIVVIVLLALLVWWLVGRSQQKKQAAASRSIGLPPHELALRKLEALAQKQLWHKGLTKEYCAELTFVLREYLEKRYRIPALESASTEMLERLEKTNFPKHLLPELRDLMVKADLVKFAKATPPETFHNEAMSFAKKTISETTPIPNPQSLSAEQASPIPNQPIAKQ